MLLSLLTIRVALPFVLLLTAIDAARCTVFLYEHDHFKGYRLMSWAGNYPNVRRNDVTSSITVEGDPGCYVVVYEHSNFKGWSKRLDVGRYNMDQLARKGVKNDQISSMKIVDLCEAWGCTCQGMSDEYGVHHNVGWGTVDKQAESVTIQKWWRHRGCNTKPMCLTWGCTCQGMSDEFGTGLFIPWGSYERRERERKWWLDHKCMTRPILFGPPYEVFGVCKQNLGTACRASGGWLGKGTLIESCHRLCPNGFIHATHGDQNCACLTDINKCSEDRSWGICTYVPQLSVTIQPKTGCAGQSTQVSDAAMCKHAAQKLGKRYWGGSGHSSGADPKGCIFRTPDNDIYFNTHTKGSTKRGDRKLVCEELSVSIQPNVQGGCAGRSIQVSDAAKCKHAAQKLGKRYWGGNGHSSGADPKGCIFRTPDNDIYFNTHTKGGKRGDRKLVCEEVEPRY